MKFADLVPLVVIAAVTAGVLLIPFERSGGDSSGTLKFFVSFLTVVGIYAILTLGLNIQWGYTGVFNFGVLAFFMLGAYIAAIITKEPFATDRASYIGAGERPQHHPGLHTDQWFVFLVASAAAGAASGLLALFLSIPTLEAARRLPGDCHDRGRGATAPHCDTEGSGERQHAHRHLTRSATSEHQKLRYVCLESLSSCSSSSTSRWNEPSVRRGARADRTARG